MENRVIALNGSWIGYAHTVCAFLAFGAALLVGCYLHYYKIVENGFFSYPDEWFPSVSATIGDRYPERSIFQILIALTAGPRFLLLALCHIKLGRGKMGIVATISGIARTFSCGGWVYITSTDDHDAHDIFMITYIVLTLPWTICITRLSPKRSSIRKARFYIASTFFGSLVPLVYLFIQHKVHRVPGAYSRYAYVEWSLVMLDIAFDACTCWDFKDVEIRLRLNDTKESAAAREIEEKAEKTAERNAERKAREFKKRNPHLVFFTHIVNSFVLWTVYSALYVCIWYFPLWHMGISGYEATLVFVLSPVLLVFRPLRNVLSRNLCIVKALTVLLGIGAYLIPSPEARLISVAVATGLGWMGFAIEASAYRSTEYASCFTLGLLLTAIAKYACWANNPVWPIMHAENGGWNKTGLVVGLISALMTPSVVPVSRVVPVSQAMTPSTRSWTLVPSLSLGSLLFSLHSMLSDSSTIITWVWEGYPSSGPFPVPHGAITLVVMGLGIYLGSFCQVTQKHFIIGTLGAAVMYKYSGWVGYLGGMVYALYLCASVPSVLVEAGHSSPGISFALALFVTTIFSLAHVWVVAYAFVPGGNLVRERTDLVLGASVFLVGLRKAITPLTTSTKVIAKTVTVFSAVSCIISLMRFPFSKPVPHNPEFKAITAGIWTIHFGLDNDMWASEDRMAELIKDMELDVVGLLESDNQRIIMGNRDLTQKIAETLGMYVDYGPGPNKHTWGAALLSKFPILNSTHHLLPSPVGELAPAIHATLDVHGEMVDVVVFHSGQEEDEEDRRLQSLALADIMGSNDRPMILLSYLVVKPFEGNYDTYVSEKSKMHDIDFTDWDRWCEYILFRKLKRVAYARVSRSSITDTELQVGKFTLAGDIDDESLYSNYRTKERRIPRRLQFPRKFKGDGVRGHRYHVFNEPRYFE